MSQYHTFQPHLINALRAHHSEIYGKCHILVDPTKVEDPFLKSLEKDGVITLNISYSAVRDFLISDHAMSYDARFNGVARLVHLQLSQLLGIWDFASGSIIATNTLLGTFVGQPCMLHVGTGLDSVDEQTMEPSRLEGDQPPPPKAKPSLKVVK